MSLQGLIKLFEFFFVVVVFCNNTNTIKTDTKTCADQLQASGAEMSFAQSMLEK